MTQNPRLNRWIEEIKTLCEPDALVLCDGSPEEYNRMMTALTDAGVAKPLNPGLRPNSYLVRSDPADVPGWRAELLSAARKKLMRGRPTIGQTRLKCAAR